MVNFYKDLTNETVELMKSLEYSINDNDEIFIAWNLAKFTDQEIESMKSQDFFAISFQVVRKFIGKDIINDTKLRKIIINTYNLGFEPKSTNYRNTTMYSFGDLKISEAAKRFTG